MLTTTQVRQFRRDGYRNGGRALDDAAVGTLADELDRVIAKGTAGFKAGEPRPVLFRDLTGAPAGEYGKTSGSRPVWQVVNIWEVSPAFRRLLSHPAVVGGIAQLTGATDLQVWHDQVQFKPAGTGGATTWHQDAPLWPSIEPMTEVTAWIPMDDADVENGCMWMVPGSQRWGNQMAHLAQHTSLRAMPEFATIPAHEPGHAVEAKPCPVRRGEVHFHHALTWHGSPENRSARPRRAIAIHFMTPEAHFTGREHVMRQFIRVKPGGAMRRAGAHFPCVYRDGQPVAARGIRRTK
jgi:hypothetical protein